MTDEHSHPSPSSIRDDSICESSLHPNKSSGDIGERTWTPEQFWEFAAAFLGDHEATTSRTMIEDRGLVLIPAAEIERLRLKLLAAEFNTNIFEARALTAESAVAAAYENAAKIAERVGNFGDYRREELTPDFGQPRFDMMTDIASAIRAAGSKKTAEGGHSPSTHNSESE